jgi:hypothetical protein
MTVVRRLVWLDLPAAADATLLRSVAARRKLGTVGRPRIRVVVEALNTLGIHTARGAASKPARDGRCRPSEPPKATDFAPRADLVLTRRICGSGIRF